MKKLIGASLAILSLVMLLRWADYFYWRYFPFEPLSVCPDKIEVMNPFKQVHAGMLMLYSVKVDKKMPGTCKVKRQLINSYRIDYDPVEPPEKTIGPQTIRSSIHVPSGTDPGIWFMRWTVECPVGTEGRVITVTRESERFMVIK